MMPFKDIVDRDQIRWSTEGMTTARWMNEVPVYQVEIADLIATQPGVLLHALVEDFNEQSMDQYPHVVGIGGSLYLEDGHHRVMRCLLRGITALPARILYVEGR